MYITKKAIYYKEILPEIDLLDKSHLGWSYFDLNDEKVFSSAILKLAQIGENIVEYENSPHITFLYGLPLNMGIRLKYVAEKYNWKPISFSIDGFKIFRTETNDVLTLRVNSGYLEKCYYEATEHVPSLVRRVYQPHITLYYMEINKNKTVQEVEEYYNTKNLPFANYNFILNKLTWSDQLNKGEIILI